MRKLSALLLVNLVSFSAHAWTSGDVSQLFPLPTNNELNMALGTEQLVPTDVINKIPNLLASQSKQKTYTSELKVVAMRIDPCFTEGTGPQDCRRMVRLVWQPVANGVAKDGAVHTFYDLSPNQWSNFLAKYSQLVGASDNNYVSLRFASEGYSGAYWSALRELLLETCKPELLSRITLMTLDFNEHQWVFRGFDRVRGQLKAISIPRVQQTAQVISMLELGSLEFRASIFPSSSDEVSLWVFDNSDLAKNKFNAQELQSFAENQLRIEDPRRENTGTVDCVACHLAQPAKDWALRLRGGNFPTPTNQLRAFGYMGALPAVSTRTKNETQHVVEMMNGQK